MQVQQMYPEDPAVLYNNLYFRHVVQGNEHTFTARNFFANRDGTRDLVVHLNSLPDENTRRLLMDPFCAL